LFIEKKARLYASYDEKNELGSMAFFAWDNKRAYYIFGASDPIKRNGHSGTAVLWDAFYDLNNIGIDKVDLEGINSPHRGWFKLSFGGDIVPYYRMDYKLK
jgi:lipid II:glycine glycyltransferase (peptidoglycan interpeptide bridge formation enzyme)